jgi:hypothetical protein
MNAFSAVAIASWHVTLFLKPAQDEPAADARAYESTYQSSNLGDLP